MADRHIEISDAINNAFETVYGTNVIDFLYIGSSRPGAAEKLNAIMVNTGASPEDIHLVLRNMAMQYRQSAEAKEHYFNNYFMKDFFEPSGDIY